MRRMHDFAELHVGCREAQRDAAFLAVLDDRIDNPVAAQRMPRPGHVAAFDRFADARGRHLLPAARYFRDDLYLEAQISAVLLQTLRIAHAALAEAEIESNAHR